MLSFQEQIISDLLEDVNGGLVVLSSGLPVSPILVSLIPLLPSHLTPLLLSVPDSLLPSLSVLSPLSISFDLPSHQRTSLYTSGRPLILSPRILIADLLTSRCLPSSISALFLFNAHRLSDTSTESFIARLLRLSSPHNHLIPIFAFSDSAHGMVSGFAKAERLMKCLYVRRLHLWPRFHVLVSSDLETDPPEVVDIRVPMSPAMKGIQVAVLEAMDACLKELRRTNKVDVEDLTVEKGLFKSFDEIVRRQLDPIWHTLGKKTKQLVSDLRTLRKLLDYLIRYDAVTYLKYLDTLRVSEGVRSMWIFANSSHKIFELAKRRVYQVVRADGSKVGLDNKATPTKKRRVTSNNKKGKEIDNEASSSNKEIGGIVLEEVLEEAPKWKVLRELLEEIEEERSKGTKVTEQIMSGEDADSTDIVLVTCKDERSCLQLEDCILKGSQQAMRGEWEKYLLGKIELQSVFKRSKTKPKEPKGFGVIDGGIVTTKGPSESSEPNTISILENKALLAAASKISKSTIREVETEIEATESSKPKKGRGKGKSKKNSVPDCNAQSSGVQIEEPQGQSHDLSTGASASSVVQIEEKSHSQSHKSTSGGLSNTKPLPPVQFYALDRDRRILQEWKPSVVIVYHPDMTFVREIEIYKSENPNRKLKVYFLFYEDSTEGQKFEASIRRENSAFESLIRQKSLMMIPVDQNGRCLGPATQSTEPDSALSNSMTRKAGGRKPLEKEMQVIVDMREFMSSLPNVLHLKGMKVIPVTLEVGDYILSPLICVERKSIGDLYQSFASGRLFHQVETMVRYYKIPVLLIEFSQDKSFSFQSASEIGDDVSPTNIISKLSLLVMHFPRLRLVWSRSLHATADIFLSLKSNQDEPDENKAMRVGVPSEDGVIENDVRAENYNTSAIEFLRRLPGVTDSNYRALMDCCNNLAELALLPVEKLAELMGSQKAARTLKEFLDAKCPTML
ncbi:DNA repair endonuclease UVH1 [Rhynchospora pubera]|uniref:DNA repair endonuclease UVH1 n=1 Tax=Rhynchospora pubera TaxID=906938 RepID=A0AAV8F0L1_9POAL|nr:DNA repair endonuclease UVH1 [Rhynchospora pubera]